MTAVMLVARGHIRRRWALVTSVRRRRRDLAVLMTLGFDRRQVRAAVASQATTIGVIGVVAGVPIGLLVGSVVWRRIADGVGVESTPVVPVLAVCAITAAALLLVNAVAYLPARAAARTNAATSLRTE